MTRFVTPAAQPAADPSSTPSARHRPVHGGRPIPNPVPVPTARVVAAPTAVRPVPVLVAALLLVLALACPPPLPAQAENGWIGKRVVQKYRNFQLQIENQAIDPKEIVTYRVEQVNGPWLWVKAEGRGLGGWAQADQVVPVEDAIAFFTDYIRANPGDVHGYQMRAIIWYEEKKEFDIALADLNEAIRLDPTGASLWITRGLAWHAKQEYDKAIADYGAAIRLDPKLAWAYYGRALALLLARREGAADSARAGLEAVGWGGETPIYTVIVGYLAAVQGGQGDRARAFLDDAAAHCDKETWPYPIVRHLRGELDEAGLLAAATDDDKRTEVHGYVGLAKLLKGQEQAARRHFEWVKEHGNRSFSEYTIAMAELERLAAKPRAAGPP